MLTADSVGNGIVGKDTGLGSENLGFIPGVLSDLKEYFSSFKTWLKNFLLKVSAKISHVLGAFLSLPFLLLPPCATIIITNVYRAYYVPGALPIQFHLTLTATLS